MVDALAPKLALSAALVRRCYRLFASRNESGDFAYAASPKLSLKRSARFRRRISDAGH